MTIDSQQLRHRTDIRGKTTSSDDNLPAGNETLKEPSLGHKNAVHGIGEQRSTVGSRSFVFALCLSFRLMNAYMTRTYDNPDEYWQAQEIAHYMVFGYPFFFTLSHDDRLYYFPPSLTSVLYIRLCYLGMEGQDTQFFASGILCADL